MKPKACEASTIKFSKYIFKKVIDIYNHLIFKFESWPSVIRPFLGFCRHRRPGINEGVYGLPDDREACGGGGIEVGGATVG